MSETNLDLKLLMVFVDVVDAGSFTAAANMRDTDVAYISRQIKKLEQGLGSVLFNRSTRSLSLTSLGNATYQDACKIKALSQNIVESANLEQETIQGTVRVTCGYYLGRRYVFPVLEKISDQFSKLTLEFELNDDQVDLIKQRFDLSLRVWKPRDTNLVAQKLHSFSFKLVATPSFIAQHGVPQSLDDLSSLPSVLYARQEHSNKQFSYYDSEGVIRSHRLESNLLLSDAELIVQSVLRGSRYGIFPTFMIQEHLDSGELIELLPEIEIASDEGIYLVYPTKTKTKAVELVIDELKRQISFS